MIKDGENLIQSYSTKFNINCNIEHDLNISYTEILQKILSISILGDDSQLSSVAFITE